MQIHFQDRVTGESTGMMRQLEVENLDQLAAAAREVVAEHNLPEGQQLLFVEETSRHFVWASGEPKGETDGRLATASD